MQRRFLSAHDARPRRRLPPHPKLAQRFVPFLREQRRLLDALCPFSQLLACEGLAVATASTAASAVVAGRNNGKCVETAEHAAVATHAPAELRGSAFGLLAGAQSFGNLAASGIAGILWTTLSPSWAFTYLAAWMVVALIGLAVGGRASAPTEESRP